MTTAPFQGQSFQTAAFRRKGKPLVAQLQHVEYDEDGTEHEVTVELRVDPLVDAVQLGAVLGPVAGALSQIGDESMQLDAKMELMKRTQPEVADALRALLVPASRVAFDKVKAHVDLMTLAGIVNWITREMSGLDPTQQKSSSDGSGSTSSASTDGQQPEA